MSTLSLLLGELISSASIPEVVDLVSGRRPEGPNALLP